MAHSEYNPFPICEKYKIDINEIITGVRCSQCGLHGMISSARGWNCKSCAHISRDAHKQAVLDYFMIFGNSMTNKQCREFLHLSSGDKTTRLMKQMNLPFKGDNKGRKYSLSLKELEKQLLSFEKGVGLRLCFADIRVKGADISSKATDIESTSSDIELKLSDILPKATDILKNRCQELFYIKKGHPINRLSFSTSIGFFALSTNREFP